MPAGESQQGFYVILTRMDNHFNAVNDFQRARRQAALQELLARVRGSSAELLSYEEVRQKLRAGGVASRGLREIPIDAIVGSVGRYRDFTRGFLPLQDSDQNRWAGVSLASSTGTGLPPIEVYQIGEAYFVIDGHHRVSIARQNDANVIEAYVTEIRSSVPITPDIEPGELIIKAEYAEFLDQTGLGTLSDDSDEVNLSVTCPGRYKTLLEHIGVHRHYMGIEESREIPFDYAALHWYDEVYLPVVEIIRELGILREFPGRTETDLYLWLSKHRATVEQELGIEVPFSAAASDLADQHATRWTSVLSRIGRRALEVVLPEPLEPGPELGQWRREKLAERPTDRLFADILMPLSGEETGWTALEQAIEVARREGAKLHGLHIASNEAAVESDETRLIGERFQWRCGEVGVPAKFVADAGPIERTICNWARWTDLVVVSLDHPPHPNPLSRMGSGFRRLMQRCSRPILAVPHATAQLSRPLLAYNGSPKSKEALFMAAYLSGRWQNPLVVATVSDEEISAAVQQGASDYLSQHDIEVTYVQRGGPVAQAILETAEEHGCDHMLLGGYGIGSMREVVLGSALDILLTETRLPMLICQ
jgi:nucleotide-binding universal stress UspA family protein